STTTRVGPPSRRGGSSRPRKPKRLSVTRPLPIEATAPGLPIQPYADEKTWMPRVSTRYAGARRRTSHSVATMAIATRLQLAVARRTLPRRPRMRRRERSRPAGRGVVTTSECTGSLNARHSSPEQGVRRRVAPWRRKLALWPVARRRGALALAPVARVCGSFLAAASVVLATACSAGGGSPVASATPPPLCGNGIAEGAEEGDDGKRSRADAGLA